MGLSCNDSGPASDWARNSAIGLEADVAWHMAFWWRPDDVLQPAFNSIMALSTSTSARLMELRCVTEDGELELFVESVPQGETTVPFVNNTAYYIQISFDGTDDWIFSVDGTTEVTGTMNPAATGDFGPNFCGIFEADSAPEGTTDFFIFKAWTAVKNHTTIFNDESPYRNIQDTVSQLENYHFLTGALADAEITGANDLTLGTGNESPSFVADISEILGDDPSSGPTPPFAPTRRRIHLLR